MQASPISARVNGVPVVVGAGKMGYVYEMNDRTGKLIWKTPVGEHNGHDNDSRLALEHKSTIKAPYTILPGPLGGVLTNLALAGQDLYVVTCDLPLTIEQLADRHRRAHGDRSGGRPQDSFPRRRSAGGGLRHGG